MLSFTNADKCCGVFCKQKTTLVIAILLNMYFQPHLLSKECCSGVAVENVIVFCPVLKGGGVVCVIT